MTLQERLAMTQGQDNGMDMMQIGRVSDRHGENVRPAHAALTNLRRYGALDRRKPV